MPDADDLVPDDRVSADLRALADWLPSRLAGAADLSVEREPRTGQVVSAVVTPHRRGAVAVGWDQEDDDYLRVCLGESVGWELPRSTISVETLRGVLDAAMAGAIDVRWGSSDVRYRVRLKDGTVLECRCPTLAPWRSASWRSALAWTASAPYV